MTTLTCLYLRPGLTLHVVCCSHFLVMIYGLGLGEKECGASFLFNTPVYHLRKGLEACLPPSLFSNGTEGQANI